MGNVIGNQDVTDWTTYVDSSVTPAVIRGTTTGVFYVASLLRNRGLTVEQIQQSYFPTLTREQAEACVAAVDAGVH